MEEFKSLLLNYHNISYRWTKLGTNIGRRFKEKEYYDFTALSGLYLLGDTTFSYYHLFAMLCSNMELAGENPQCLKLVLTS